VFSSYAENIQRQQLYPTNHLGVKSRLLVRRLKKSTTPKGAAADIRNRHLTTPVTDAGDRELQTQAHSGSLITAQSLILHNHSPIIII